MNFQMILETLRMASIISFTFREAVADVEYKGKIILEETINIIPSPFLRNILLRFGNFKYNYDGPKIHLKVILILLS